MNDIWKNIGKQIKQKRTSQNLTQKELGEKIGASNTYIWKLENQNKKCSVDKLQEIADALDCKLQVNLE